MINYRYMQIVKTGNFVYLAFQKMWVYVTIYFYSLIIKISQKMDEKL